MLQEEKLKETINNLFKLVSEATDTTELLNIKLNLITIADILQDKINKSLQN